jgi:hypothetical protein
MYLIDLVCYSNFDLSRTLFAQTKWVFCPLFQKWLSTSSGAVQGRAALGSPFLFCQAFFFVALMPKKKALQKANYL